MVIAAHPERIAFLSGAPRPITAKMVGMATALEENHPQVLHLASSTPCLSGPFCRTDLSQSRNPLMDDGNLKSSAETFLWTWQEWKHFLERSFAFSNDALHVIAGTLLIVAAAFLLRKSLSSWWPWLVVATAALINEFIDLWVEHWPDPEIQYGEGLKDLLLTMLLPTVLLVVSRVFPWVLEPQSRSGRDG